MYHNPLFASSFVAVALCVGGCTQDEVVPNDVAVPVDDVTTPPYHAGTFSGELHYTYHHQWQGPGYTFDTTFQITVQVWAASEVEASPRERFVAFDGVVEYRPWTGERRMRWDEVSQWYGHYLEHMTFHGPGEDSVSVVCEHPGTTTQVYYHFTGVRQQ